MGSFVAEAREELGGLHILVNNAGIVRDGALWHLKDDEWEAVLRTNLDGAFYFTRAVAPFMRSQEHGKIVNVTSVHGIRSEFGIANYASSKAGLIGLTKSSTYELGPRKINVNAVALDTSGRHGSRTECRPSSLIRLGSARRSAG